MENRTEKTNLLLKSSSQHNEKIKTFELDHVSILVEEISPTVFSATALEFNSPLRFAGNAKEVGMIFGKWVENTLNNMAANGIKEFLLYAQL